MTGTHFISALQYAKVCRAMQEGSNPFKSQQGACKFSTLPKEFVMGSLKNTAQVYVLILLFVCPDATICVLMLLYMCSHTTICVRMLLYVCPHATICVLILLYVCPHTTIYVSSSSCWCMCVLMLLYMCPHAAVCVSSCYSICVLREFTSSCKSTKMRRWARPSGMRP